MIAPTNSNVSLAGEQYCAGSEPLASASKQRSSTKKVRILSIDGGGMRGIIPATIVWHLEHRLQQKADDANARISDYFDFMAGTSTGGILTCTYLLPDPQRPNRPKLTAKEVLSMYLDQAGCGIFSRSLYRKLTSMMGLLSEKYCSRALEKALKRCFGQARLRDFLKPCLTTAYDITARKAFFFTSLDAQRDPSQDYFAWEVARATASAPAFFSPAILHAKNGSRQALVDGGVFANNPCLCAFTEARKACFSTFPESNNKPDHPSAEEMVIVSLGTGTRNQGYAYEDVKSKGMAGWAIPIIDLLMSASTDTVDYQLRELFAHPRGENSGRYYRINPPLKKAGPTMDNIQSKNRWALYQDAMDYINNNKEQIEQIIDYLLQNH